MSLIPIALWNLKVPSGGAKIPGYDDEERSPWPYRITMAAIDSSTLSSKPSTLKLHKRVVTAIDEDDEDEEEGSYDLSPDEDEVLLEDDSEDDELDDIDAEELHDLEGRIEEIM